VNVETGEQSEQWIHTHIHHTSRKSLNESCMSARMLMTTVFCNRKGGADDGIHTTRDHTNVISVFRNTKNA
jgi:hypothetical protein